MEQNILKRYNEIHTMLWEEVLKVFASRTSNISDIKYYRENGQLLSKLYLPNIKRTALLHLFVRGQITEEEKNNLLICCNCSACYIANEVHDLQVELGAASVFNPVCYCCPIEKWRNGHPCNEYKTVSENVHGLKRYVMKCINDKEKFNLEAYTRLRKAIMKKMYIVAHLEWGYEQNEV